MRSTHRLTLNTPSMTFSSKASRASDHLDLWTSWSYAPKHNPRVFHPSYSSHLTSREYVASAFFHRFPLFFRLSVSFQTLWNALSHTVLVCLNSCWVAFVNVNGPFGLSTHHEQWCISRRRSNFALRYPPLNIFDIFMECTIQINSWFGMQSALLTFLQMPGRNQAKSWCK